MYWLEHILNLKNLAEIVGIFIRGGAGYGDESVVKFKILLFIRNFLRIFITN